MTGSGTQFNMNVNEVISNRAAARRHAARQQNAGAPERSRQHVAVVERHFSLGDVHRRRRDVKQRLIPAVRGCATRSRRRPRLGTISSRSAAPTCRTRRRSRSARNSPATSACWTTISTDRACADGRLSPRSGWHRGRHRDQRPARLRRGPRRRDRQVHRPAVRHRAEQICRARRARRPGAPFRHAADAGGLALQDRQRHPPAVLRAARGLRRADHPGERARLVDHAGQGQSDPVRGADDGRGPGHGQDVAVALWRRRRQFGDERLQAADDPQRDGVDPHSSTDSCTNFRAFLVEGTRAEPRDRSRLSSSRS